MQSNRLKILAAAVVLALPLAAQAESAIDTTSPYSAAANVNFRVVIPGYVFLQVGTGTLLDNNSTIDRLTFSPTLAEVGNGPIAGTGGNAGPSGLLVDVRGNVGALSLGVTSITALSNGSTTIPWTQIVATAAGGAPTPPVIGTPTSLGAGPVISAQGQWNYQYANTSVQPVGTYDGQLRYTLTSP